MPKFHLEIPHTLGATAAKAKMERFIEMLRSEHGEKASDLEQSWTGDTLNFSFKTFGIKIAGNIGVKEHTLDVNGDIPFAAMMFKGKIESEVRDQLTRLMR